MMQGQHCGTMRIGGEFRGPKPGDKDFARWHARVLFLDRVSILAPETLTTLWQNVLPLLREAHQATLPPPHTKPPRTSVGGTITVQDDPSWWHWRWERRENGSGGEWRFDAGTVELQVEQLRDSLRNWGARWHLSDSWLLDVAFDTLRLWWGDVERETIWVPYLLDDDRERIGFRYEEGTDDSGEQPLRFAPPVLIALREAEPFAFEHDGWPFFFQPRSDFMADVRASFEAQLKSYVERIERTLGKAGYEKTPAKYTRRGEDSNLHFELLARWQCQKWTWPRIADRYGYGGKSQTKSGTVIDTGVPSVKEAVQSVANEMGLTLRRGRPGRPSELRT